MYTTIGNKKEIILTGFDPFILNEFDNKNIERVQLCSESNENEASAKSKIKSGFWGRLFIKRDIL